MNIDMYRIFYVIQKKHWWFVTKKNIVLDVIDRHLCVIGDIKVLDIGCGSGLMLNALEDLGQTYGMDMSDDAINFSKEIFSGKVEKGVLPDQIPYQKDFFNLITALDVIEHIDEDVASLKAIHALLVSDGKAVITVPAYMFLWSKFDELNEHKRRYTLTELNTKLVQAGFTVEKISYFNTLLFPVVFVVRMLNNVLERDGASDMDMPSRPLNFVLEKIFGIERYLLKFANLPFGVSVLAVVRK
ncbi:class I SAM-dependent methyltransferase [Methylicorpusculum sp.]|uniref:class I SAM-dependent methyltransferase n=1 Tax=Methylicorpusculum sp. TaxID=2713644 RepID=UPI0027252CF1|nr:class I SAM-dependent methyltransferase [Methylicorpusculum sp.]MDO8843251.1 class I SAM-dependent methyltransferase [Methylicorpusculum sp.]